MGAIGTQKYGELMKLSGIGSHGWRIIGGFWDGITEKGEEDEGFVAPPNESQREGRSSPLLRKKNKGFYLFIWVSGSGFHFGFKFRSGSVEILKS